MFSISLNVVTEDHAQRATAFFVLTETARTMEAEFPSVVVSSHKIEDDEITTSEEYFDEYTMLKVVHALRGAGIPDDAAESAIIQMQNAGILFRERTP